MNKEEQIEEMAKAIYKSGVAIDATDIAFGLYDTDTHFHRMATKLYAGGYGNVKQAVKEFAEKLKEKVEKAEEEIVPKGCDHYFKNGAMCCQSIIFLILEDLVKEVCGEK